MENKIFTFISCKFVFLKAFCHPAALECKMNLNNKSTAAFFEKVKFGKLPTWNVGQLSFLKILHSYLCIFKMSSMLSSYM